LIELSVAVGVMIVALSGALATAQSYSKTGRELELMQRSVDDTGTFCAYESNLHMMGGPNYFVTTANTGDLTTDYATWLQTVYQYNSIVFTTTPTFAAGTGLETKAGVWAGYIWQGAGVGASSAVTDNTNNPGPGPGGQLFLVSGNTPGNALNASAVTVCYVHVQGPVVTSGSPAAVKTGLTLAAPYETIATAASPNQPVATGNEPANITTNPVMNEAVQWTLTEDPHTGIVAVAGPALFGAVNISDQSKPVFLGNPVTGGQAILAPAYAGLGADTNLTTGASGQAGSGF